MARSVRNCWSVAECNSAIRQTKCLRYDSDDAPDDGRQKVCVTIPELPTTETQTSGSCFFVFAGHNPGSHGVSSPTTDARGAHGVPSPTMSGRFQSEEAHSFGGVDRNGIR